MLQALPEDTNPISYRVVYDEEGPVFQRLANPELEQYEDIFRFMGDYRDTISGKIAGFIKIDETPIDEYVFDEILSFTYQGTKVQLKKELQVALRAYSKIIENIEGELILDNILALDDDVLMDIVTDIASL